MQDGFYEVNNLGALDRDAVLVDVGQVSSIRDFHIQKWGGKGTEDWVPPTFDQHLALPAPPAGSDIPVEGEELEDDVPPPPPPPPPHAADFSISQEAWVAM